MHGAALSRHALRDQNDAAERAEPEEEADESEDSSEEAPKPKKRTKPKVAKTPAKPRTRKKAVKEPTRMVARWAVCDNGAKWVAVFEYKDRAGAEVKLAEVRSATRHVLPRTRQRAIRPTRRTRGFGRESLTDSLAHSNLSLPRPTD